MGSVHLDHDTALLRLETPAQLTATVQTVPLVHPDQPKLSAAGKPAVVTGWGNTQSFPQWPDGLRQVTVPLVAREACDVAYQNTGYPPGTITDTMICAGVEEGGKDSCQGDSGGPLVVEDSFLGWWQVGVVSWGEGCALPQIPGVYAHVPAFTDWIDRRVASITLSDHLAGDSVRQRGHLAIGSNVVDTWNHADRCTCPICSATSRSLGKGPSRNDMKKIPGLDGDPLQGYADFSPSRPGSWSINAGVDSKAARG
ncbi:MAG: serine protease [Anaerolineales bacterium]|nr:serine protease [Anaerolineales bacterium]